VAHNLRRALRRRPDGVLRRLLTDLDSTLSLTDQLLAQTALRVKGQRTIPDRLISLADPDARTIRRGKPRRPNEFGYKVLVAEGSEGFVVHHRTERGNPPDHDLLLPAVEEVAALTGRVPETVVADRGFGPAHVEESLLERGVKREGQANGVSFAIDVIGVSFDGSSEKLRDLVSAAFEELLVARALMREELP